MDSPHILTRSQKKQLCDTEASSNTAPQNPSSEKIQTSSENAKSQDNVQTPGKRLQPSRLSKNPVTPNNKTGEDKVKTQTDESTTLSQNKVVQNSEHSQKTPQKFIPLWKPCESPKRKLSTIHENGKENICLEEVSLTEKSTALSPIREERMTRSRRRSTSTSPSRSVSTQSRVMTRRSMRSLSESRTFPDSPLIEECTKTPSKMRKSVSSSHCILENVHWKEIIQGTSDVTANDKSPKKDEVIAEKKTSPSVNIKKSSPVTKSKELEVVLGPVVSNNKSEKDKENMSSKVLKVVEEDKNEDFKVENTKDVDPSLNNNDSENLKETVEKEILTSSISLKTVKEPNTSPKRNVKKMSESEEQSTTSSPDGSNKKQSGKYESNNLSVSIESCHDCSPEKHLQPSDRLNNEDIMKEKTRVDGNKVCSVEIKVNENLNESFDSKNKKSPKPNGAEKLQKETVQKELSTKLFGNNSEKLETDSVKENTVNPTKTESPKKVTTLSEEQKTHTGKLESKIVSLNRSKSASPPEKKELKVILTPVKLIKYHPEKQENKTSVIDNKEKTCEESYSKNEDGIIKVSGNKSTLVDKSNEINDTASKPNEEKTLACPRTGEISHSSESNNLKDIVSLIQKEDLKKNEQEIKLAARDNQNLKEKETSIGLKEGNSVLINEEKEKNLTCDTSKNSVLINEEKETNLTCDTSKNSVLINEEKETNLTCDTSKNSVVDNKSNEIKQGKEEIIQKEIDGVNKVSVAKEPQNIVHSKILTPTKVDVKKQTPKSLKVKNICEQLVNHDKGDDEHSVSENIDSLYKDEHAVEVIDKNIVVKVNDKSIESDLKQENVVQKSALESFENTLESSIKDSVDVVEKCSSIPLSTNSKVFVAKEDTKTSVSKSSDANNKSTESSTNGEEYLGTHKIFYELLEDQCTGSPKKETHNTSDSKVSNKESSQTTEQSDTRSVKLEVQNDREERKVDSDMIQNSSCNPLIVDEKEREHKFEGDVSVHIKQNEKKLDKSVNKISSVKTISFEGETIAFDSTSSSNDNDDNSSCDSFVNTKKNTLHADIKHKQHKKCSDNDVFCVQGQEHDENVEASVEADSVILEVKSNINSKKKNMPKMKENKEVRSAKRNKEKVEAKVEACSVILEVKRRSSESTKVAPNEKKLKFNESVEYNNKNHLNIQQEKKKSPNKTSMKNKSVNSEIPKSDDSVKTKKETSFIITEVKDNIRLDNENISEPTNTNLEERLHKEKELDVNVNKENVKKMYNLQQSHESSQSDVTQKGQNSSDFENRKMRLQFKKFLKNINFTELLELLTVPNEQVKSLNLSRKDLNNLKRKVLESTEYKEFASTVPKEKTKCDKKIVKQINAKDASKSASQGDELHKSATNKDSAVGGFNKNKSDKIKKTSAVELETSETIKQKENETESNLLQRSDKTSKKKKRNKSKKKARIDSTQEESSENKSKSAGCDIINNRAKVMERNELEVGNCQVKKQNKPEFVKIFNEASESNKRKIPNEKQESNQQTKKQKHINQVHVKTNQESEKETLALKSDKHPRKFVEKQIKHNRNENKQDEGRKQFPAKQYLNENQILKKRKKKNRNTPVQPTFLKTAGSLFKVEASTSKPKDQGEKIIRDTKDSPAGFTVIDTKGTKETDSGKSILQVYRTAQELRNSKEYKASLQLMKKNIETNIEDNMFKFSDKPKKDNKRFTEKKTIPSKPNEEQLDKKPGIKRLPSEILEALNDKPLQKKKKEVPVETKEPVQMSKRKKLKLKSAILEESYIPLSADSATQFAVARLDKEPPLTSAQNAANFRNNQLYGAHNKRVSAKDLHSMKEKYKANSK